MIVHFAVQIVYILFCHWVIDFVGQSKEAGENKSKSIRILFRHALFYSLSMTFAQAAWTGIKTTENWHNLLQFWVVTFVCHFITDFFTSRYNAKQYAAGKIKRLLNGIGFDQWLHQGQLVFTILFIYYAKLKG